MGPIRLSLGVSQAAQKSRLSKKALGSPSIQPFGSILTLPSPRGIPLRINLGAALPWSIAGLESLCISQTKSR